MNGTDERPDTPIGPAIPVPGDDEDALIERCAEERDQMTPRETADCAGATLAEQYENEEDGGS